MWENGQKSKNRVRSNDQGHVYDLRSFALRNILIAPSTSATCRVICGIRIRPHKVRRRSSQYLIAAVPIKSLYEKPHFCPNSSLGLPERKEIV